MADSGTWTPQYLHWRMFSGLVACNCSGLGSALKSRFSNHSNIATTTSRIIRRMMNIESQLGLFYWIIDGQVYD